MPAVAVIRKEQVLFTVIGCKGFVDGYLNIYLNSIVMCGENLSDYLTRVIKRLIEFMK